MQGTVVRNDSFPFEVPYDELELGDLLKSSAWGKGYKGALSLIRSSGPNNRFPGHCHGQPVAIKILKKGVFDGADHLDRLKKEVCIMRYGSIRAPR